MKKNIKIFSVVCFLYLLAPGLSFAANVFIDTEKDSFATGETFLLKVFLDTENISVNAVGGRVVFPENLLSLEEIQDGNSAINFWIEKPSLVGSNSVVFSGITAGGFYGPNKLLFSVVFKAKNNGAGTVSFSDIQVLQNDGVGTKVDTVNRSFGFFNTKELVSSEEGLFVNDKNPPEDFFPSVASDPEMFGGAYFVVFSTQDKESGIGHYEVREGFWGEYIVAESPFVLNDQSLIKKIYIKAIDNNKNERVVSLAPQNPPKWYEDYLILSIILLVIIGLFTQKKWQKFIQ